MTHTHDDLLTILSDPITLCILSVALIYVLSYQCHINAFCQAVFNQWISHRFTSRTNSNKT